MLLSTRRLFVAILFLGLFAMAAREISDPDFWWHLRTGQYIVENGVIPHSDIFSFTNSGKEWITHEWLSEVLIYLLYRAGGYTLLIVCFAALIAASFALAYLACPGKPYIAAFVVLLGAIATAPVWGVRPQIFSLVLTSLFLLLLEAHRRAHTRSETEATVQVAPEPKAKSLKYRGYEYLLPLIPLTVLWVNLHSGFAVGLVLVAAYLLGLAVDAFLDQSLRAAITPLGQLATVLAGCLLVVPLNPNGLRMFTYPLETLTSPAMQRYIQEWFSPDFHQLEFQPFALLLLALVTGSALSRVRISASALLLVLLFGYASLRSARNIPMFALVAIPLLGRQLAALAGQFKLKVEPASRTPRLLGALNTLILLVLVAAAAGRVMVVAGNQARVEQARFPAAAVDFLASQGPPDRLYDTYGWGGYLIWRLYPSSLVYIDGRADVYGDTFIEQYLDIYRAGPGWDQALDAQGVRVALLERGAPLSQAMAASGAWREVYADTNSVIFQRK